MLVLALEAIRRFQAHRKPSRRLQWNRIVLHVWPTIDLTPPEIRALGVRLAPSTAGLGVEMVLLQGRLLEADGTERDRVLRLFTPAGRDVVVEVGAPPSEPLRPLDEGAQRMIAARRRGLLHPAEIIKLLAPAGSERAGARTAGRSVRRARPRRARPAGAGRPSAGDEPGGDRRRPAAQLHRAPPGGDGAGDAAGRSHARAGRAGGAGMPPDHRGARPRRGARRAARVVRALRRRTDRHGQRDREHGLDRRGAAAHHRVHATRRRDQRRRRRHQRRRPAVLERRGDDADAHQGHPRHDARQRDGADGQAFAGLLGRRLGRGQLRHRRLRAHHGPQRPGAVLGPRPRRRVPDPPGLLRARLLGAGRALPAASEHDGSRRARHRWRAARRAGQ